VPKGHQKNTWTVFRNTGGCNKFKKWPPRKKSQHSWCWAIISEQEKDNSSDQENIKSQPLNLIEGRSIVVSHCRDWEGN
jgi:hypothetical protein